MEDARSVGMLMTSVTGNSSTLATRFGDYAELTKPRILVMILLTVAVAMVCAGGSTAGMLGWLHIMVGTALVAGSASAMNQWIERERDALMPRTCKRPLPAGRIAAWEAAMVGWGMGIAGTIYLAVFVNSTTAMVGLLTWGVYVWIYTPLKVVSWWNTAVGTLPGALPVFMGWAAAGESLASIQAWAIFGILVAWQFPHFMAIAWLYRQQYEMAGYKMLTVTEPTGRWAAWHGIVGAVILIPLIWLAIQPDSVATWLLTAVGIAVSLLQVKASFRFAANRDQVTARRLLRSSLVFLPAILAILVVCVLVR